MAAPARGVRTAVLALCLVQFVDVLGVTVVVTALPRMLADLHAADASGALIATGYAMFFSGLLMLGARLGDRYGHRRIVLIGLGLFALAAVFGATAATVLMLTGARCLQGAAAAVSVPSALRLLTTITAEGSQRRRAVAAWSAAGAAAGASGFVVGGVVTQLISWRAVFWGYLPLAVLLAMTIIAVVQADPPPDRTVALNVRSVAAFTATVMCFVVATTLLPGAGHTGWGATLFAAAAAFAVLFVVVDRRAVAPLLPAALLRRQPLREGASGAFVNTATTSSTITLTTLYLQNTRGRSPLEAGLLLLPFSLAVIVGSALAARALDRWPPQRLIAAGLTAIAVFDAALTTAARSAWVLPICLALGGIGIGLSSVAATSLGTTVPVPERATASGILNTAAQLGTAIGIALVLLAANLTHQFPGPSTDPPVIAWALASTVALISAVLFAMVRRSGRSQPGPSERATSSS
jgi:MFS family permease